MAQLDILSERWLYYKAAPHRKDDPSSWNPVPKYTVAPSIQKKPVRDD